jgi:hypothetical protein
MSSLDARGDSRYEWIKIYQTLPDRRESEWNESSPRCVLGVEAAAIVSRNRSKARATIDVSSKLDIEMIH